MKELFVSYELALLAKDKGFDEECLGEYIYHVNSMKYLLVMPEYYYNQNIYQYDVSHKTSAPLYQQIVDWFREKHNYYFCTSFDEHKWNVWIEDVNNDTADFPYHLSDNYYEALNEAILEAFKLI